MRPNREQRKPQTVHFAFRYTVKPPTGATENMEQGYSPSGDDTDEFSHISDTGVVVHWLICIFTCSRGNVFPLSASSWPWNILAGLGRAPIFSSHLLHQQSWLGTDELPHQVGLRAVPVTAVACCGQQTIGTRDAYWNRFCEDLGAQ